jgi:hypothetical protein
MEFLSIATLQPFKLLNLNTASTPILTFTKLGRISCVLNKSLRSITPILQPLIFGGNNRNVT